MIKTYLKEAATPLHLLGLYRPQIHRRPSHRSLTYSASQKYPLHSRCLTLISNRNPMWYIEPRLATLQELVGLRDPRMCGTVEDPRWPHLTSQRGMPSNYGSKLRWDLDTFYCPEDDSFSTDFALEALNHAYPGCTGVYLDSGGHMLAFYGRKGSPKAGLIQEVAIEAGHTVAEIPRGWVSQPSGE